MSLKLLRNASVQLQSTQSVEVLEKNLALLDAFSKKYRKSLSVYEAILTSKLSHPSSDQIWGNYCKIKKELINIIDSGTNEDMQRHALQICLNFLFAEIKFCSAAPIFDTLVKDSIGNLLRCLCLDGTKKLSITFIQFCNKKPDYIVFIVTVLSSSGFTESFELLDTTQRDHLVKCLLKFNFESAIEYCKASEDSTSLKKFPSKLSKVWLTVLTWHLSVQTKTLILTKMRDRIIPTFADCRDLTDFLIKVLEGDSSKLKFLALECFYVLVAKYNIEYPGVYDKLLAMCSEESFQLSSYTTIFLEILKKFLMSTKLSLEILKLFIVRLGHIVCKCESGVIISVLNLLQDILLQHKLVSSQHYDGQREEFLDVLLTLEASMQMHYNPKLRKAAAMFLRNLDENDVEQMSQSVDELMEKLSDKAINKSDIMFNALIE